MNQANSEPSEQNSAKEPDWPPRLKSCIVELRKFFHSDGSAAAYVRLFGAAKTCLAQGGGVNNEQLQEAIEWEFSEGPTGIASKKAAENLQT